MKSFQLIGVILKSLAQRKEETCSIILCALLLKKQNKKLTQTKEDLWDIYSSTQRKKWQIAWWKQQHSYCLPREPAKLFCVEVTALEAEWHIAWDAAALTFSSFTAVHTDAVIVMLSHVLVCRRTRWQLSQIPHPHACASSPINMTQWLARWWTTRL